MSSTQHGALGHAESVKFGSSVEMSRHSQNDVWPEPDAVHFHEGGGTVAESAPGLDASLGVDASGMLASIGDPPSPALHSHAPYISPLVSHVWAPLSPLMQEHETDDPGMQRSDGADDEDAEHAAAMAAATTETAMRVTRAIVPW